MRVKTVLCGLVVMACTVGALPEAKAQFELKWAVEGYYRARGVHLTNLAPESRPTVIHPVFGPVALPNIRRTSYLTHRMRLSPRLEYGTIAKLFFEINALNDVVWGDNNGIATAPLFALEGSNQGFLGGREKASIELSRAWVEFMVPVGLMRVGRMPSHWGMGLLANGGGQALWDPAPTPVGEARRKHVDTYFDDDFGDNHFGSTADRILFATRPITLVRTLQKKPSTQSNFLLAYVYDKITEAPSLFAEEDRRFRPFGQQGFLSRGGKRDDIDENIFVAAYVNPDWDQVSFNDELKFGTYWVVRSAKEGFTEPTAGPPHTPDGVGGCVDGAGLAVDPASCVTKDEGSFIVIADFWAKIRYGNWYGEAEFLHIGGETTGGVPFPSANQRTKANINAGVLRLGHLTPDWDALLEFGFSSGDDNMTDGTLKQRPIHPDFNVGLIMFEEVIRERSARVFGAPFFSEANLDGARGFMSNGGVVNAKYAIGKGRYRPGFGGFELVGQVLVAWLDKWSDGPNVFNCPGGVAAADCTASKFLGTEIDVAIKSRFAGNHMDFSLESGILFMGDPLKRGSDNRPNPNAPSTAFTLQARIAYVF